ncbi:methionyl-tRNA formyltransferase [Thiobacillus denitrificans ATCC 25259]|uniref:Methionyl-tRNA formyltransferase n=1 Tax=Thiobacillus denitrificans (strain ATCC 25259 / T1) TaxID=292415 RepID=FMT_THIDA|nr:methionyl-tRNA formyltransferase [Thiobacillus denitrificans]Q3SMS3.1 RecName: Full=Methionyl-tRNA formyltransferase [Thiobacillus denitrificans ATCC 25259]AAZ95968.1 methionyl-tRNA formyltransferase [Thiobacillus denitrificans ATCC 25259]
MRVIFAGTPPFAAAALEALVAAGHEIVLVLTQPDRPAGRGMKLAASAVKQAALAHGLPVYQPTTLKTPEAQARLADCAADVMVVAAYGLILPQAVLDLPRLGCLNIHASLLPRWRGAAPIQRAILAGDCETGITIMQMAAGLDTGAMLAKTVVPIADADTAATLHDALAVAGAAAIVSALSAYDTLVPQTQDEREASYAAKLSKEEARLDWQQPAEALARAVRAFNPVPGAWTLLAGAPFKILRAEAAPQGEADAPPGTVLRADPAGIVVACGGGALVLHEIQAAGSKRMTAAAFLAGRALSAGTRLGA